MDIFLVVMENKTVKILVCSERKNELQWMM